MTLLGRKKKTPSREEALSAKPIRLVEAEPKVDENGGARLTVQLRQSRWTGRFIRMPEGATKTFEFDSIGLLVWNACDGKTTVKRVVQKVAENCGISPREAEVATFTFLQMLAKKNLVGLAMEKEK
jgi:hypothetical protein